MGNLESVDGWPIPSSDSPPGRSRPINAFCCSQGGSAPTIWKTEYSRVSSRSAPRMNFADQEPTVEARQNSPLEIPS